MDNAHDIDPISQEPVRCIPAHRLFTVKLASGLTMGYDAFAWVRWLLRNNTHPTTREPLPVRCMRECYEVAVHASTIEEAPPRVERCLRRFEVPVSVRYVTIFSLRPVRWSMLLWVSPMYKLVSLDVQVSDATPPFASVSYEVLPRDDEARSRRRSFRVDRTPVRRSSLEGAQRRRRRSARIMASSGVTVRRQRHASDPAPPEEALRPSISLGPVCPDPNVVAMGSDPTAAAVAWDVGFDDAGAPADTASDDSASDSEFSEGSESDDSTQGAPADPRDR